MNELPSNSSSTTSVVFNGFLTSLGARIRAALLARMTSSPLTLGPLPAADQRSRGSGSACSHNSYIVSTRMNYVVRHESFSSARKGRDV
jgi:hypothetical protein